MLAARSTQEVATNSLGSCYIAASVSGFAASALCRHEDSHLAARTAAMSCESRSPRIPAAVGICVGVFLWLGSTANSVSVAALAVDDDRATLPATAASAAPTEINVRQA